MKGSAQAYSYTQDEGFRRVGSGIMLGGLGLTLVLWIIYTMLFVVFVRRYFAEHSISVPDRVYTISLALFINIVAVPVQSHGSHD